jgi:hypothetical protein
VKPKGAGQFRYFEEGFLRASKDSELVEALARVRRVIAAAHLAYPQPDLAALSRTLGVAAIRTGPLGVQGRVATERGSKVIELSDSLDSFSRSFVLAHELAHIAIGERKAGVAYTKLEAVCDYCAGEILLPNQLLRDSILASPSPLDALWALARTHSLPMDFALRRAQQAGAITKVDALSCRVVDDRWLVVDSLQPRYPHELADCSLGPSATPALTSVLTSGEPRHERISLQEGLHVREVMATIYPLEGQARTVLVVLKGGRRERAT